MSDWLVALRPTHGARARIVALPWAGGTSAVYRSWVPLLPADIALSVVRLPGRESRFREPPLTDVDAIIGQLAPVVADDADVPTVIFGYSLGALLGYELAVRLQGLGSRAPALLAVGGSDAPHLPRRRPPTSELDDEDFVAALRELEGTPAEVFEHPELLALVLPAIRADFRVLDSHRPRRGPRLSAPIVTYSGAADSELTADGVARWSELTAAPTRHRAFPGGHFFLLEHTAALVAAVVEDVTTLVTSR